MVFLGTPFHGSPAAPWGKVISTMVSIFHNTDSQKVKDLDEKSEKLQILAESFASAMHQRIRDNNEIRVAFFNETKKLHGMLVSQFCLIFDPFGLDDNFKGCSRAELLDTWVRRPRVYQRRSLHYV